MRQETIGNIVGNIRRRLEALREMTATPGEGVTRFPFTEEARQASEYLMGEMRAMGLAVRLDPSGSVIGRLEGERPETVMMGSHLDSVLHGGAYDGAAGVVCALEAARMLVEDGGQPCLSVEVIATNDEEGSRFRTGLFSGKFMLGQLSPDDLKRQHDADGVSVYDAMRQYGLDPEAAASPAREDLRAFLEVHIEQGPVLEAEELQIGAVSTIVGIRRARVVIGGRADHVGTMPMDMRQDALETAARVIAGLGDAARSLPNAVATVGNLTVEPNIMNIIPSRVAFTVDFRGVRRADIDAQYGGLLAALERETALMRTRYSIEELLDAAPVDMRPELRQAILASCARRGYAAREIVSGAGHDAQVFGARIPAAMIFVPSKGGRSHCPEEESSVEDLARASLVLRDLLNDILEGRAAL
ncbi:MAG: Zn-dependent hydrolase [Fretibacterium sp.]|nr:Zn-dependent hydrolase [Fretibacterium sp.]